MWTSWDLLTQYKLFLIHFFEFLQPFFKKDTILILESGSNYNDLVNVTPLVEYLVKNKIKCKFVFNYENPTFYKIKGVTINHNKNSNFFISSFFVLLKTHTIITGVGLIHSLDNYFCRNPYINYIYSDHGVCLLKDFKFMGFSPERFNYFLVSNSIEKNMVLTESTFKEHQLIETGLLRFDKLEKKPHPKKNIFIMFTWRRSLKNTNYWESCYHKQICCFLLNKDLQKIVKDNNITVTITLHPCMHKIEGLVNYLRENIENEFFKFIDTCHISKFIGTSDLFITDYSSLFFDFAYLNIPVIFYRFDANEEDKEYLDSESISYACSKDHLLYNCTYSENEVISHINKYLKNSFQLEEENIQKNLNLFDFVERGKCCENFIKKVEELRKAKYDKFFQ